jgi:hypothetical protein
MSGATLAAIRFAPLLPAELLAALALLAVLAVALAAWRRAPGTLWRALCFAAMLLWLAGPRLVQETRQGRPDVALLVIDQSASMRVADRAGLAAKARATIEADIAARHQELGELELRTLVVPEAGNAGTQLFAAIDRALADIQPSRLAGVVMVTDGQVHDIPTAMPQGVPLHVLLAGRGEETNRRVRVISAPGYGIVGQSVSLRAVVEDLGVSPGLLGGAGSTTLTIRRDGETPIRMQVPIGREQQIDIPITRAGPGVVEFSAEPLPGAVSGLNRREVVTINGVRDRLRVLLVSGEPHQGERTWRRLLKADPSVDLVHFTILRPPEKDDLTPLNELALIAFPVRELFQVKIREFDLIILDRFTNRGLLPAPYLRNIADYVRGGGALLVSAGPEFAGRGSPAYTALGDVIPARPLGGANEAAGEIQGAFRPLVSELGIRHPITQDLPGWRADGKPEWGPWYRAVATSSVKGDVLMRLPDGPMAGAPLLVTDRVGQGRVALLLSDQIWLWSRGHQGGGPQAELLRRVAHWLMQEPELDETALTARVEAGQLAIERRSTAETAPPPVTVTDPAGGQSRLALTQEAPGRFTARLPAEAPGVWQATDGERTAFAASGAANKLEFADLRATASLLAPLARASGGSVHWLAPAGAPSLRRTDASLGTSLGAGGENNGAHWIGLPKRDDHVVIGVAALPLLPPWLALPLIFGLAVLAWRREAG